MEQAAMNYFTSHFAGSTSAGDDTQAPATRPNPSSMAMPMQGQRPPVSNGNGPVYPQGLSVGQQSLGGPSGLQRDPSLSHRSSMNFDQSSSDQSRATSEVFPAAHPGQTCGPSLKRGMACGFCRRRKLRCSGGKPMCTNCQKYKKTCEYTGPPNGASEKGGPSGSDQSYDLVSTQTGGSSSDALLSGSYDSYNQAFAGGLENGYHPQVPSDYPPPLPGMEDNLAYLSQGYDIGGYASAAARGLGDGLDPSTAQPFPFSFNANLMPSAQPDLSSATTGLPGYPDMGNKAFNTYPTPPGMPVFPPHPQMAFDPSIPHQAAGPSNLFVPMGTTVGDASSAAASIFSNAWTPSPGTLGTQSDFEHVDANVTQAFPIAPPPAQATMGSLSGGLPRVDAGSTSISPAPPSVQAADPAISSQQQRPPQHQQQQPTRLTPREHTFSTASSASVPSEVAAAAPAPTSPFNMASPDSEEQPYPKLSAGYRAINVSQVDPIEGLTERLGEFLFSPPVDGAADPADGAAGSSAPPKRRKVPPGPAAAANANSGGIDDLNRYSTLWRPCVESDGLTDAARNAMLDVFLAHSRLFFEMSIPRFRYRMTFSDHRRPSLALLNAMYLWATRMSNQAPQPQMEAKFYQAACRALDAQTSVADRLLDGIRAAMLLSAYVYTSGRFHEGWLLSGMAVRLVISTGLHQIPSLTFQHEAPQSPTTRRKVFLLPPPEDALELAERVHTFWAALSIERCGATATGYPSALADGDITTPFNRPQPDIAAGTVTQQDDYTLRDLYRVRHMRTDDSDYVRWLKAMCILERASKLAFIDPEENSEYANAWGTYSVRVQAMPNTPKPPAWLDQPKYRCPKDYRETKLGLDQLISSLGPDGIFPTVRKRNAELDGGPEPFIPTPVILLHHLLAAVHMLLHDINSPDCENKEALVGPRRSVAQFRGFDPLPFVEVDSFTVLVWGMLARCLVKEAYRLQRLNNNSALAPVLDDIGLIVSEMNRIGQAMHLARAHAKAIEDLMRSVGLTPTRELKRSGGIAALDSSRI